MTYRDRPVRFAYDFLSHLLEKCGCKLVSISQEETDSSDDRYPHLFDVRLVGGVYRLVNFGDHQPHDIRASSLTVSVLRVP